MRAGGTLANDVAGNEPITRDPNDDYLVRLARAVGADVLVSGDRDLLEANLPDVAIVSPRTLIEQLDVR